MISTSKANAPTIQKRTVARGRLPNAHYRTREYLTEREIERLMKAAGNNRHGHRDATMILLAFRHGLRASELCSLRWEQIDLAHGRLHVDRKSTRLNSSHANISYAVFCLKKKTQMVVAPSCLSKQSISHSAATKEIHC